MCSRLTQPPSLAAFRPPAPSAAPGSRLPALSPSSLRHLARTQAWAGLGGPAFAIGSRLFDRTRQLAITLLAILLCSLPAHAWNAAGHRLVAHMAWEGLPAAHQAAAHALLSAHPDFSRWASAERDTAALQFAEAATWADTIRHDPRFYDDERGEAPTPALPGLDDTARHRSWHYVDLGQDGTPRKGQIDRQIPRLASRIADPEVPDAEAAYALVWLLHLVADIHQPLHVGEGDDEGGNRIRVDNPSGKGPEVISLHRLWDDLPGPPWLRGKALLERSAQLQARYQPGRIGSPLEWVRESHALHAEAYPGTPDDETLQLSPEFLGRAREIARQRLSQAGERLAALLNEALAARVSRETNCR